MMSLNRLFPRLAMLRNDQRGVTAIEYALIAGLMAAIVIPAVSAVASAIEGDIAALSAALKTGGGDGGASETPGPEGETGGGAIKVSY